MHPWLAFILLSVGAVGLGGCFLPACDSRTARLSWAILLGVVLQSLLGAFASVAGCSFANIFWGLTNLGAIGLAVGVWRRQATTVECSGKSFHWTDALLLLVVADALLFGAWAISNTPLSSEDGIFHWSGRARFLFGGVNWSWSPADENYLGLATWNRHYPLLIPVWRATLAGGSSAWSEVAARADGLLFYAAFVAAVWSLTCALTRSRFWASVATAACACQPLLIWHVQSGNADLTLAAFLTAAMNGLVRRRWAIAGLCTSGAVLTKNEGLLVYLPALLLGLSAGLLKSDHFERKPLLLFLLGLIPAGPWLLFRLFNRFQLSPSGEKVGFQPDAILPFLEGFGLNPTSYFLWIAILTCLLIGLTRLWQETGGKELLIFLGSSLGALAFVFVFTEASKWLAGDVTLQRILMQLSGIGLAGACSSLALLETSEDATAEKITPVEDSTGATR